VTTIIVLAVAGIMLIMAEVFLPGGILGFFGFCCIGGSIYFAYSNYGVSGLAICAVVVITSSIFAWLTALRILPKTKFGKDLFLTKTQKGYDTRKNELQELIGKSGVTESALRPTGKVDIDGDRYDVVSDGNFIEQGVDVLVTGTRSNQLVVEESSRSDASAVEEGKV